MQAKLFELFGEAGFETMLEIAGRAPALRALALDEVSWLMVHRGGSALMVVVVVVCMCVLGG